VPGENISSGTEVKMRTLRGCGDGFLTTRGIFRTHSAKSQVGDEYSDCADECAEETEDNCNCGIRRHYMSGSAEVH
jgi:hypothetical protein